jgi:hypothetical protein
MPFFQLGFGQVVQFDTHVDRLDPRPQHLAEAMHLRRERKSR